MKPLAAALLLALPVPAQEAAEALLESLTLEQKAGQLFMSWSLSRSEGLEDANNHDMLLSWVRDAELGGVILSLGTVADAATLIPKLQAASKVPLLLAGDFEGGVWFRLSGATELGNQMLLGATRSERLAEDAGRVTGEEAKALGFHWVFAPVLDVNSNPDNPIINVRSFGEDPELVARMGAAFARGVRGTGLIPCGKHFPGHGDVDSDSHLELPTVPGDAERLRRVELRPFALCAKEGLESVMTGHLAVPGLGEDPKVPATLSRLILGDVLRKELGFTGMIVTDALEMGGVKNAFPPGEVAVRALLAGADVLLMPPDPIAARAAVVEAVQSGRVPMARLDDAVRSILQTKARVGLLAGDGRVDPVWQEKLQTDASLNVAREIAREGITLVRNRGDLLPLRSVDMRDAVMVTVSDRGEDTGLGELRKMFHEGGLYVSGASAPEDVAKVAATVGSASRVIVALHAKVRAFSGEIGLPAVVQPVLDALRDDQEVIAVSFGNPYLIESLPSVDAYLCAYVHTAFTEAAAARAILALEPVSGRLPVSIRGVAAAGEGIRQYARSVPGVGSLDGPDYHDAALASALTARLRKAIVDHAFPGAVAVVARHGQLVASVAVGRLGYEDSAESVTSATPFDLASLTKVCATTPAVLRLIATGRLSLDDKVGKWVPAFTGEGKDEVTIRHLLAHCAGLPAYVRFFRTMKGKDAIVEAAAKEGLMLEPGTSPLYSDLGFILLMAVVESCSGEQFSTFVQREVFGPLQMRDARFVPTDGPALAGAAPTENDPDRGGIVRGYVHDENAYAMGGISGHAGMFAKAHDVLHVGLMLLSSGRGFLPRALVAEATRPAGIVPGDTTRGLGYQMLQPGSWAGTEVSPGAFGHTGFTGTSLWCDPELDVCVVLLTNRAHPTRVNDKITAVRRDVHDLVRAAMR